MYKQPAYILDFRQPVGLLFVGVRCFWQPQLMLQVFPDVYAILDDSSLHSQYCYTQVGLDDVLHPWFQQSSIQAGKVCLEEAAIPRCRATLQRGAPPALRPRLWAAALALDLDQASVADRFQELCGQVEECNLLTDLLVGALVSNHPPRPQTTSATLLTGKLPASQTRNVMQSLGCQIGNISFAVSVMQNVSLPQSCPAKALIRSHTFVSLSGCMYRFQ